LVMPTSDERPGNAASMQSQHRFITQRSEDRWCTRIRRLLGAVRPEELDPVGHEQDRRRVLPDGLEPGGLRARVKQRDAVAVFGELGNPVAHLVPIERRIEINESKPIALQTVGGPIGSGTGPGSRIRCSWIEIEWPEPVDDPAWRDVDLRLTDGLLVRSEGHGCLLGCPKPS
jgi:hypothetical protein